MKLAGLLTRWGRGEGKKNAAVILSTVASIVSRELNHDPRRWCKTCKTTQDEAAVPRGASPTDAYGPAPRAEPPTATGLRLATVTLFCHRRRCRRRRTRHFYTTGKKMFRARKRCGVGRLTRTDNGITNESRFHGRNLGRSWDHYSI